MLTVKPYDEGEPGYGYVYTVSNRSGTTSISIERNEASAHYATAYIVTVNGVNDRINFTFTDEEMQEFMLGYLAVKKEIEEG